MGFVELVDEFEEEQVEEQPTLPKNFVPMEDAPDQPDVEPTDVSMPKNFVAMEDDLGGPVDRSTTRLALMPTKSADTINDLMDDDNFNVVNQYMDQRFGMREGKDHNRQEVVDSFVNHMRKFSFGQSITTVSELAYLNKANEVRKQGAGQAYTIFDNMKGAFSEEYTFGQKADAVVDYARALILDPINIVSLGVGKLVSGGATKAAAQLAKEGVKQAIIKELGPSALKKGVTPAVQAKAMQIERRVLNKVIKGTRIKGAKKGAFQEAMKGVTRKEILATTAVDSAAATTIDGVYQQAMIQTNVQSDYNVLQGAITGVTGVMGGSLAYGLSLLSKAPHAKGNLPLATYYMDIARKQQAAVRKQLDANRNKSNKKAMKDIDKIDMVGIMKKIRKNNKNAKSWSDKVMAGDTALRLGGAAVEPREGKFISAFLNGDADGDFKGIDGIFKDFGIDVMYEEDAFKNFADFAIETINALPAAPKAEINALYNMTLKKVPAYEKVNLKGALNMMASQSSNAGSILNALSQFSKALGLSKARTAAGKMNEVLADLVDPAKQTKTGYAKFKEGSADFQQNFIRMLVTHPGTVALNITGWVATSGLQSYADMIRGGLYGGASIAASIAGKDSSAVYAKKAKSMLSLQGQAVRNLVDPYATKEAALDFLANNPSMQKELFRYISGGIELNDVYKEIGIDLVNVKDPSRFEKAMDLAQAAYGVRAQDIFSKTQAFMYSLDKHIRINYDGMSYADFISDSKLYSKMDGETFIKVQADAVKDAQRMVSAKSYKGDDVLGKVAGIVEDARKMIGIGALVPFGQFFNNTLGHMFDYTGITFLHKIAAGTTRDPLELTAKAAAGLSFTAYWAMKEKENMEEGLGLFEERHSDGSVRNRTYDFPYSWYKATGRLAAEATWGDGISKGMWETYRRTFGTDQLTRQLGDTAKISSNLLEQIATQEDINIAKELTDILRDSVSMYTSAYSRPLDPINSIISLARGEDYTAIDRKQGNEWLTKSARYVDQIFIALGGEELAPEKNNALTDRPGVAPIGRIFGYREVAAQTNIERMFNDVGKPKWRTEIKTFIPEVQNNINKIVFHYLDRAAKDVVHTNLWDSSTLEVKERILADILKEARDSTVSALENTYDPEDRRMGKLYDISKRGSGIKETELQAAMRELGLSVDMADLESDQIDFLKYYIKLGKQGIKSRSEFIRSSQR